MKKATLPIATLVILLISACSSTSSTAPFPTTPTPKCKGNICIREAIATADQQYLSLDFLITDQNGTVDTNNPPKFDASYLSVNIDLVESDGTEKNVFGVLQRGSDFVCAASNVVKWFKGQLVDLCGFLTPQTATAVKVQAGDYLRITLKEFNFDQVVKAYEPADRTATATNGPTSITDAYLTNGMFSGGSIISTTTFSKNGLIDLIVIVANASSDTKVKSVWTAVDLGNIGQNVNLDEIEHTPDAKGIADFAISPALPGKYKVDLYLNGRLDRTLEFSVK